MGLCSFLLPEKSYSALCAEDARRRQSPPLLAAAQAMTAWRQGLNWKGLWLTQPGNLFQCGNNT